MDINLLLGLLGMTGILAGFILTQTHRWSPDDRSYDLLNLVSSLLLAYYAYTGSAWPFLILNLVWAAISLRDLMGKGDKLRSTKPQIGR